MDNSVLHGLQGQIIHINGIVQGVGFRPHVWKLANDLGITGTVQNNGEGVLIEAWGDEKTLDSFLQRLEAEAPPLARIDELKNELVSVQSVPADFQIILSVEGETRTGVAADAATCPACIREVFDPENRRYRYPFTNCTHCGPRLSIIRSVPYDRKNTSMDKFPMCLDCQAEYDNPEDRRFHAQPNACSVCGPVLTLVNRQGNVIETQTGKDEIQQASDLIKEGHILAIKGIGGFHLACDASNQDAVKTLRQRKRRYHKPFALMARDIAMVKEYALCGENEECLLKDKAAPIVILDRKAHDLPDDLAPSQNTLGFMLPYTPLHHLLLSELEHPIVLTSGNLSDEPQCISNDLALTQLNEIADFWLMHDRDIVNRLDDSVIRIMDNAPRYLRRARGYAPEAIKLPEGFEASANILAMGGELKNTFCLTKEKEAIVSQYIGDLEDVAAIKDYQHNIKLYQELFDHEVDTIVVDKHPDYLSTKLGKEWALIGDKQLIEVQHHHAHITSCMAEHGLPIDTKPVLGVAMDGLGFGEDGTIWGGEFLLADYKEYRRLASFQPVAMPGGVQAILQPWRNTLAYLLTLDNWSNIKEQYSHLELVQYLDSKSAANLETIINKQLNSPLASSCGRLFDAVAAALDICRDAVSHEGQAAVELEALAVNEWGNEHDQAYMFVKKNNQGQLYLCSQELWLAILKDIESNIAKKVIAARFHWGLARSIAYMINNLTEQYKLYKVVLNGGVFQNRLLLEGVMSELQDSDLQLLSPKLLPANDGGISFGQAAIAIAKLSS